MLTRILTIANEQNQMGSSRRLLSGAIEAILEQITNYCEFFVTKLST